MNTDEIQAILARIESDLITDRSKLDKILIEMAAVKESIKQLYDRVPRLENKLRDAVVDGMGETLQPAVEMVDALKSKTKHKKRKFFNFLGRR